ncbi:MAG: hypothetical protein DRP68_03085 [Candidatus Omnitrophota bacterium]|nr:MAG: hypothetical protein DRP68_03085 [Candidatus Omnitrophota bacterium]RKY39154.1 MAG: hypothetical protein DRP72_00420 [Candidatus Omnitrophota bacterium]RKY45817.1 MAG: hypothetical protein DRP81_02680 [Candidatus Omnitrophota bacterium]
MLKERRRYPRFTFALPIKISNQEFDVVTETKNISGNGAYCSVDKEIPIMTKLKIVILVPLIKRGKKFLKKINCKGVVVRSQPIRNNGKNFYNIGIFFCEIKEIHRKVLFSYINSALKT